MKAKNRHVGWCVWRQHTPSIYVFSYKNSPKHSFSFFLFSLSRLLSQRVRPQTQTQHHPRPVFKQLPSPFLRSLLQADSKDKRRKEYQIGLGFAHELDLYQAMTAFKRAEYLTPSAEQPELNTTSFSATISAANISKPSMPLKIPTSAPSRPHSLLPRPSRHLYDCYLRLDQTAERILGYIQQLYPETAQNSPSPAHLFRRHPRPLKQSSNPDVQQLISQYAQEKIIRHRSNPKRPYPRYRLSLPRPKPIALHCLPPQRPFIWATVHFFQRTAILLPASSP